MNLTQIEPRARSRRALLQLGWKSAAAVLALGGTRLSASSSSSGRALVHLQLFGGNDSNNMIVNMDSSEYRSYAAARGDLAIPSNSLLPVQAPRLNGQFGFHPDLAELHDLYQRQALAVVANTGSMPLPLTKAEAISSRVMTKPGDHFTPELTYVRDGFTTPSWASPLFDAGDVIDLRKTLFTFSGGGDISMLSGTARSASDVSHQDHPQLLQAMRSAPIRTPFPETSLGRNLKHVAQLIHAAPSIGATNPVILCSHSNYDTRAGQLAAQSRLFRELSTALAAFDAALVEIGASNRVTLYTQSEFNRTLTPNANGGTEAAWGGHELVMGRSVLGGDVYGKFPSMAVGGAEDAASNGTWIPSTSNVQYHATLASWMGVSLERLPVAFPTLSRFAVKNLGFVA
jgi:uncharacterized protein (DUF1501 family)